MEQLFDPLLEYSPQALDYSYVPPAAPKESPYPETQEIGQVIEELFNVQTNFTMDLVSLLQDFIIPLRVNVLADVSESTDGSMKVNAVFPPTIDEITRINCILNNTLKIAIGFGYPEVFKVLASILPFFYKAFARHQANIMCFHARFEKFLRHNRSYAFENEDINKNNYTPKIVENIILGSLFELPKLKLIIKRLYDLVVSENLKASNFESSNLDTQENIDDYYRAIIETIDSLGFGGPDSAKDSLKSRIFTPSGKLLTELATEWPEELQYGWMNRKVLAIYELKNVMPSVKNESGSEALIIFSDHLLFLDVIHATNEESTLSLPDVLMNSLINQKPLPNLENFPQLKVKYWCDIEQILAKSYEADRGQNLTLIAYGDNCFHSKGISESIVSVSYSVQSNGDSITICNNIISHICKAQILHKCSPFHLFKYGDLDLTRFYCAHDLQNYDDEISKSPIVILLNVDEQTTSAMFEKHPSIFIVLSLSFLNEHTLQILGYNRENSLEVNEIVSTDNVTLSLKEILARCMEALFHSSSLKSTMLEANSRKIKHFVDFLGPVSIEEEIPLVVNHEPEKQDRQMHAKYPGKEQRQQESAPKLEGTKQKKTTRFVSRILNKFRSKQTKSQKQSERIANNQRRKASIPQTGIPRGKKPAFKKLYKPAPSLDEQSTIGSISPAEIEPQPSIKENIIEPSNLHNDQASEQHRILSNNTVSSSTYSGSVDVHPDFQFPRTNELARISEDTPLVFDSMGLERPEGNMGSVRYAPKKLKKIWGNDEGIVSQNQEIPSSYQADADLSSSNKSNGQGKKEITDDCQTLSDCIPNVLPQEQDKENDFSMNNVKYSVPTSAKEPPSDHQALGQRSVALATTDDTSSMYFSRKTSKHSESDDKLGGLWQSKANAPYSIARSSSMLSKGTCFSGKSAANALENLNASGLSSRIYSKYKIYEELPMSIFNGDTEANWTCFTRDSYSNLQSELEAMKLEINDRKVSSVRSVSNPMMMKPVSHEFDTTDDTLSSFEFVSYIQENQTQNKATEKHKSIYDLEASALTSEEDILNSFSKQLDRNFSLRVPGTTGSAPDLAGINPQSESPNPSEPSDEVCFQDCNEGQKSATRNRQDSFSTIQVPDYQMSVGTPCASSEDEYFSSHEFSSAFEIWNKTTEQEQKTLMMTSSSSEMTLMNDLMTPRGKIESEGEVHGGQPSKWADSGRGIEFVDRYGSLAYLSDILTGEVAI
ncbi:hypothetical protein JCM33374_g4138 [Metschnikowia sp. JCM 33374]|nr:hypothetical protein JCM33374_g4138 [Metschnikowia sp. JCM 33374]